MQVVESKNRDGADGDRHQIAVFAEDMQQFLQGIDRSLNFIEKDRKQRAKIKAAKKAEKEKQLSLLRNAAAKKDDGIKRTGRIHVVSKRKPDDAQDKIIPFNQ